MIAVCCRGWPLLPVSVSGDVLYGGFPVPTEEAPKVEGCVAPNPRKGEK